MINLDYEKEKKLSTQDICDILTFAIDNSQSQQGFVNSFVFNRAIYLYAAIILYPDRKEEIASAISENLFDAWDALVEDSTIEKMLNEFEQDLDNLCDIGERWFKDYIDYAHSIQAALSELQLFSGDFLNKMSSNFSQQIIDSGVPQVFDIAEKWGMGNSLDENVEKEGELPEDSLYSK